MRNYAIIKNGVVLNVHYSDARQARLMTAQIDGASLKEVDGLPVQSGDDYADGEFHRNGVNITGPIKASRELEASDAYTGARGVEDLIEALIMKGTITEADLPSNLVSRLNDRKSTRTRLQ